MDHNLCLKQGQCNNPLHQTITRDFVHWLARRQIKVHFQDAEGHQVDITKINLDQSQLYLCCDKIILPYCIGFGHHLYPLRYVQFFLKILGYVPYWFLLKYPINMSPENYPELYI